MRILAIGDLHGEIGRVLPVVEKHAPDLLLGTGDWGDPGQVSEAELGAVVRRVHTITIYGNHDDRELLGRLRNRDGTPVLLGQGEVRRAGGLTVAGISGIWAKTKLGSRLKAQWESARRRDPGLTFEAWAAGRPLPPYVTDDEVASLAAGLAGRRVDILLMHACPVGLADRTPAGRRGGQRSFRGAVNVVRPRLALCGHLHLLQREDLPDGRVVLNTGHGAMGEGWVIEWDGGAWSATNVAGS